MDHKISVNAGTSLANEPYDALTRQTVDACLEDLWKLLRPVPLFQKCRNWVILNGAETWNCAMENAAFLVLHFQNGVAHPEGVWGKNLHPQVAKNNSVENTRAALQRARARGLPIIYVNIAYRRGAPELPFKTCGLYKDAKLLNACEIGSWGAAVIDELAPADDDIEVINYTSDGFEGTELELILRMKKIDKLYFTGQCVEHVVATTFKRAVNMGYEAVLLTDCTSGFTDENYAAMMNILPLYGELVTSQQFIMS